MSFFNYGSKTNKNFFILQIKNEKIFILCNIRHKLNYINFKLNYFYRIQKCNRVY